MTRLLFASLLGLGSMAAPAFAQAPAAAPAPLPDPLTLQAALQYAVEHYPAVKGAVEQVNASAANVRLANAAYLPRLDSLWQTNRATVNNVTGLLLPQSLVPGISGPPLPSVSSGSVWGSAAGALFSWEPFDMGLRDAGVRGAEAAVTRARADESLTRLDVQGAVGAAFLASVHAELAVTAAQADVERRTVLAGAARALVDNQLRAGAEASRAEAERAAADTRLILARQTLTLSRVTLARVLGATALPGRLDATTLLAPAPPGTPDTGTTAHPLVQARQAAVDVARMQENVLAATNRPRLYVQSAVFARGSGATPNGSLEGGASGLGLDRGNWATGLQVVFPDLFSFPALRARRATAAAATRAEGARYDEAVLTVTNQQRAAAAMLEAARAVAANIPAQINAARESEAQATARYRAGLSMIAEVADAQALLAQAEYQSAAATVDVWRALLADGIARGDLAPFARLAASGGGAR